MKRLTLTLETTVKTWTLIKDTLQKLIIKVNFYYVFLTKQIR